MNSLPYGMKVYSFPITFGILLGVIFIRYLLLSGGLYYLCWIKNKEKWMHKRIQPTFPKRQILVDEFKWSIVTSVIFALSGAWVFQQWAAGKTAIYADISQYGWGYFFLSFGILMLVHETYFYWTHRLFHIQPFFKWIHMVHHYSRNPSPWAAFSFHPWEALFQAIILPLMVFYIPVHPAIFVSFLTVMTVLGVINHTGYELYPAGMARHWLGKWFVTATHHDQHHSQVRYNYGLYFTFWDHWFKTHHTKYEEIYDEIKARKPGVPVQVKSRRTKIASEAPTKEISPTL